MTTRTNWNGLHLYMGFDGSIGSHEGAALIFAHTSKEAKKVFWAACKGEIAGEEFTQARVRRIVGHDYLFDEADGLKVQAGLAHVNDCPKSCDNCETWGNSRIGDLGLCHECLEARRADERDGLKSGRLN